MELVGTLPALPSRKSRRLEGSAEDAANLWDQVLLDSVDATRTMLLHLSRVEGLRTLMVTSAMKGEGKTSLACHLATSLARARRRTLLIDLDLRCPAAHALFDLPLSTGVCGVLRGEMPMADAIRPTIVPGLSVMTAGLCDSAAIESLAHEPLKNLLEQVRDHYDFIIIDSAPVLAVADTLQISQHVDAVILSILRDVSRLPLIHDAYERLTRLGARILGAVVAGVDCERYGSGYYGSDRDVVGTTAQAETSGARS
jgi:capsular exopolysaccharide synthesis family protein